MNVVIDTPVWSIALRRAVVTDDKIVAEITQLIGEGRVVMLGAVRQELLSGIRNTAHFRALRERLRAFPDLIMDVADYEDAADCFNRCRSHGIQGSNTDFLICAASRRHHLSIFTMDEDFGHFAKVLKIELHRPLRRIIAVQYRERTR